jgi:hypothetical protein
MPWNLPEPMPSAPVPQPDLRPDWAAEAKWDAFRALVSADAGAHVSALPSRAGAEDQPTARRSRHEGRSPTIGGPALMPRMRAFGVNRPRRPGPPCA